MHPFTFVQTVNQPSKETLQRRKVAKAQWLQLLKEKKISSERIKQHIMNFFGVCGNYELLETFSKEAGVEIPKQWKDNKQSIELRFLIRNLITSGKIQEAIQQASRFDCTFDKKHESILFNLKLLKVIKLIEQNYFVQSVELAQKELVPMAKGRPQYISDIEKVMTLIAFKDIKNCPNKHLCEEKHSETVAYSLNQVLAKPTEVEYLTSLVKLQKWCQDRLRSHLQFPLLDVSNPQLFE